MNVERMVKLAETLEAPQDPYLPKFNMSDYCVEKGSWPSTDRLIEILKADEMFLLTGDLTCLTCCLWPKEITFIGAVSLSIEKSAAKILDLTESEARMLSFSSHWSNVAPMESATREQAAVQVRLAVEQHLKQQ